MVRKFAVMAGCAGTITAIACGGNGGSDFGDNPNGKPTDGVDGSSPGKLGDGGNNPTGSGMHTDGGGGDGGVGNVTNVAPDSGCASATSGATRPPAYLVFMYDRSISMGDKVGPTTSKWDACQTALDGFFASASSNIHASLTFFGKDAHATTADCSGSSYATPDVSMRALPDSTDFSAAIANTGPSTDTPTVAAEQGAIKYAQSVAAGLTDGGKVAIVLVTDGDPLFCGNNNTVANVAAEASAVAATIPTYVVGIGDSLRNLNDIASAGKTGSAILVSTNDPGSLTSSLQSALGSIAKSQLGCNYGLPAPPAGQTLDVNAVNVDYTPSGMAQRTLPYSADCANGSGWHYDSTSAPKTIVMCPTICDTLKGDSGGKVDIVFGCTTTVTAGGTLPIIK
jgi:hypothetical protein